MNVVIEIVNFNELELQMMEKHFDCHFFAVDVVRN